MLYAFFDTPIFWILSLLTSIAFTLVAVLVPVNGGNLVGALLGATFGGYLFGEDQPDEEDRELADDDI